MRHNQLKAGLAPLLISVVAGLVSCQKSPNPKPSRHNDAAFSLRLTETRQSHEFAWSITEDGAVSCEEQDLQEVWVTEWNSCRLEATSSETGFDGVNFSSSRPDCISVKKIDDYSCSLEYKSDSQEGEPVMITASSGGAHSVSFPVFSKDVISLLGVSISVGGLDVTVPLTNYKDRIYPDDECYVWFEKIVDYSTYPGDTVRIGHLIPENASFRYLESFRSYIEGDAMQNGITSRCGGAGGTVSKLDWSEIDGLRGFYKPSNTPLAFNFNFRTGTTGTDEQSGKLKTAALRGRYDYQGRVK